MLTYVFETDRPLLIAAVVALMMLVAAWIALRPLTPGGLRLYPRVLVAVAASGLTMLAIVTPLVLDLANARRTALDAALIPQINGLLAG